MWSPFGAESLEDINNELRWCVDVHALSNYIVVKDT